MIPPATEAPPRPEDTFQGSGTPPPPGKTFDPELLATIGDHLAPLPEDERERGLRYIEVRAINGAPDGSVGELLAVSTLGELFAEPHERVTGLWGRWLIRGELSSIAARGGAGKTTFTRNLMLRSAQGGAWLGEEFEAPLRWIYFTREGSPSFFRHKAEKVATALGVGAEALDRIEIVAKGGDCGLQLSRPKDLDLIRRTLDRSKSASGLDVISFDPFTRFKTGSENDDQDMAAAIDSILDLQAEFEVASWVPHHSSQSGKGLDAWRGHTTFEGGMSTGFLLTGGVPGEPTTVRKMEVAKARYSDTLEDQEPRHFDFDPETEVYAERDGGIGARAKIRATLGDGAWWTVKGLESKSGAGDSTVRRHLEKLEKDGRVESDEQGPKGAKRYRQAERELGI